MSRRQSLHSSLLQHPDYKLLLSFFEAFPNEEILYNCWVKKINDRGNVQDRLLVLGSSRIVTLKNGGVLKKKQEVARSGHLFGITRIESPNKKEISIFWPQFKVSFNAPNVDVIITKILEAFYSIANGFTQEDQFSIIVDNSERIEGFVPPKIEPKTAFFSTFEEMCKWKGVQFSQEEKNMSLNLAKIIDSEYPTLTIHHTASQGINESLITALRHSPLFKSLEIPNGDELGEDILNNLKSILKGNSYLEEMTICNVKNNWQWTEAIGLELQKNPKINLKRLRFMDVPFSNKGFKHLVEALKRCKLISLRLNNCDIGPNEISFFTENLKNSLPDLDEFELSNNDIGMMGGTTALCTLISKLPNLKTIALANIGANFTEVLNVILTHPKIATVDLHSNHFSEQHLQSLQNLLNQTQHITEVNISNCNLSCQNLSHLLWIVKDNENGVKFNINASKNKILSNGDDINALERVLSDIDNLYCLNLDDCELGDDGIQSILDSLKNNASLRILSLNRNLPKMNEKLNTKQRENTCKELISFLDGKNQLQSLSISGSSIDIAQQTSEAFENAEFQFGSALIAAIPHFRRLRILDISCNHVGEGAEAPLIDLVKNSTSLVSLHCDENLLSLNTYREILHSLRDNKRIAFVSPPVGEEKLQAICQPSAASSPQESHWPRIASNIPKILTQTFNTRFEMCYKYFTSMFLRRITSSLVNRDATAVALMDILEKMLSVFDRMTVRKEFLSYILSFLETKPYETEYFFGVQLINDLKVAVKYFHRVNEITKGKVDITLTEDEESCVQKFITLGEAL